MDSVTTAAAGFSTAWSTGTDMTAAATWDLHSLMWMLVVGFVIAFILSFAVGANDVANSFGTAVGAKVLTLRQACILATVFETAGAVLIGAKVGETIRKGIIDVTIYDIEGGRELLMMGNISAMFGSAAWQLIATLFKLPVSGTHSIVGACIGFSLVAVGPIGVNWFNLGFIVASWFISPVISGFAAVFLFYLVERFILNKEDPLKNGLRLLPVFYAASVGLNIFSFIYSGAPLLGFDKLPMWSIFLITLAGMILVGIVTLFTAVPRMRKQGEKIQLEQERKQREMSEDPYRKDLPSHSTSKEEWEKNDSRTVEGCYKTSSFQTSSQIEATNKVSNYNPEENVPFASSEASEVNLEGSRVEKVHPSVTLLPRPRRDSNLSDTESSTSSSESDDNEKEAKEEEEVDDPREVRQIFSTLQILTACFASFAHGGNDVCNAIGPLIALWLVYWSGEVVQKSFTPWYLLLYGGFGVSVGLWVMGRRVIYTIGQSLTKVTPSRGFCIELMTAITVLVASNVGIPVSTTHCKVGAVVSIGWYRSRAAVDWSVVRNIAFAWFVTVPISGILSAGAMFVLIKVT